jgi:hypothetical protein
MIKRCVLQQEARGLAGLQLLQAAEDVEQRKEGARAGSREPLLPACGTHVLAGPAGDHQPLLISSRTRGQQVLAADGSDILRQGC